MNLARIKIHFTQWREWELNPIVIKELRQAVRSWAVTGMLLLLLLVLFVVSMIFLVTQSFETAASDQLGGSVFQAYLIVLAAAGILFIPLYLGLRVAAERQDNNPDLLYISTLSPTRIIRGKFFCGAYVALLFFSAAMPFMALTNLLRGVDLPTVFFLLAFLFLVVCAVNLAAIFIACLPVSRLFKILLTLGGFIFLFYLLGWVVMTAFEIMRAGVGAMLFQPDFLNHCLTVFITALAGGGLFYVLAVALISPPSANRALVPRIYLTVLWFAGGIFAGGCAVKSGHPELIFTWAYPASILLCPALVVCVSNHDQLSLRVRRKIPRSGLVRLLAFCFYNGAAGGLVWVASLAGLTFFAMLGFFVWLQSGSRLPEDFVSFEGYFPPMLFYFFAYALFARSIHRRFLPRQAPKIAGILAVFITALTALGTNIVLFFMNQLTWRSAEHLELGNAFNLMGTASSEQQEAHLLFAFLLLVIALALNIRWFSAQWKDFRPPAGDAPARPD